MKKTAALVLVLAMLFAFTSCEGTDSGTPDKSKAPEGNSGTTATDEDSGAADSDKDSDAADNNEDPGAADDDKVEKVRITLATGGTSGTYYAVGCVLFNLLGPKLKLSELSVESTGASKANTIMIADGEAQMAILQSDVINYAHEGTNIFQDDVKDNALWIAGIYNETVQILARPGIFSVSGLRGKTVCVGDIGSGTEINAWQVLNAAGLTENDIHAINGSFQDGVDQLQSGQIDAAFTVAGAPTNAIIDYATVNELNLISLSDRELDAIQTEYPFLIRDDLKADTYFGQASDVACVAVQAALVASEDLDEDVVYEITRALFENKEELAEGNSKLGFLDPAAASVSTIPLHPGAEKYYKEIGVL